MTHEKGASSETACGGSTDVDQKVHTKFKDFVQGYDLSLLPPNSPWHCSRRIARLARRSFSPSPARRPQP